MSGRGDDDGLCESSEACVFTPNPGFYQGEDAPDDVPCQFADGAVHGVQLFGHTVNGAP